MELKFPTKKLNPHINLPFNILIPEIFLPWQSYLEYKLLGVGILSRYSEYLLMVKVVGKQKELVKGGVDRFDLELTRLVWSTQILCIDNLWVFSMA